MANTATIRELAHGVPSLHPERKGQLNVSPGVNYVEKRGGLPPYLNSVATALVKQGMPRSRAIATAVNVMKKTCATGLWGGHAGRKVSAAIQAAACNAVRQWEQLKVSTTSVASEERLAIELANRWEEEGSLELAWDRMRARAILDLARPKPSLLQRIKRRLNLAGPSTMERRQAAAKGQALPGGRFPIRNGSDLDKAIRAVGRARPNTGEERNRVRRFIIKRARALGLASKIPSSWNADGSLS